MVSEPHAETSSGGGDVFAGAVGVALQAGVSLEEQVSVVLEAGVALQAGVSLEEQVSVALEAGVA